MPEGHVAHRNALRLTTALGGRRLVRVHAPEPRIAPQRIPERLRGDRVERVEAAGKHHLFRFASGRTLHSHLQMTGRWRLLRTGAPVPRGALWIALETDAWVAALYRGPMLRLLEPGEQAAGVPLLGPDLLDAAVDPGQAARHGLMTAEPTLQVGDALMDQRIVSGIGNVYKSEACFLCGVDPWRPVGSLTPGEAEALGATAARLLADGVRDAGSIVTYRPPGGRRWSRERTWVYGRRGRPCRRCGTPVRARGQGDANRTTFWCPTCQR